MGSPYARPVVDPEVTAVIGAWLARRSPADLEGMAIRGDDMTEALRRDLGILANPIAIRAFLGAQRVAEFSGYTDDHFQTILDDLLVSRPDHGAILAVHEDWYLQQVRRLQELIVRG